MCVVFHVEPLKRQQQRKQNKDGGTNSNNAGKVVVVVVVLALTRMISSMVMRTCSSHWSGRIPPRNQSNTNQFWHALSSTLNRCKDNNNESKNNDGGNSITNNIKVVVVVVADLLTLTLVIKSVVTAQAPVTPEWKKPRRKKN